MKPYRLFILFMGTLLIASLLTMIYTPAHGEATKLAWISGLVLAGTIFTNISKR